MPPAVATVGRSFRPWTIIAQSGAIQNDFGHCGIARQWADKAKVACPRRFRDRMAPRRGSASPAKPGSVRSGRGVSECPLRNVCRETSKTAVQRRFVSWSGPAIRPSPVFHPGKGRSLGSPIAPREFWRQRDWWRETIPGFWSFRDQRRRHQALRAASEVSFPRRKFAPRRCGRARGGSQRPPSRERLATLLAQCVPLSRPLGSRLPG